MIARLRAMVVAGILLTAGPASAQAPAAAVYDAIAGELIELLRAGEGPSRLLDFRRIRIAIWPFGRDDDLPIAHDAANTINDALLPALLRRAGSRYVFLGRSDLRAVIADLEETAAEADAVSKVAKGALADMLLIGRLDAGVRDVLVSYKVVTSRSSNAGQYKAASTPRPVPVRQTASGVALDRAIADGARRLLDRVPDLEELRLAGVRFRNSGRHTDLGAYLEQHLAEAIAAAAANALTGRRVRLRQAELGARGLERLRGIGAEPRDLKAEGFEHASGAYTLGGSYWDFDDSVEVKIRLSGKDGRFAAWSQKITKATLPSGIEVRPPSDGIDPIRDNDNLGPVRFVLSSTRGDNPRYRVGETAHFTMLLGADAWVYCFYRQADGSLARLFPNPYHGDARLAGRVLHEVPSRVMPFDLRVKEPAGTELLKCFATSRDVRADLPPDLADFGRITLPATWTERLPIVFRQIRNATVSEASLVVTVTR